jgi:hypothetical protein
MNFWKHDEEVETEPSSSGALVFVRQTVYSFFALQKEWVQMLLLLSTLRRSWEDGNCHDGGSYGWARPTTISATLLGTLRIRDRHLQQELAASAFVRGKLTVGIDLTFEDVENACACNDGFKIRVAGASKR